MEQSIIHKYGSLAPSHILRYFLEDTFFQTSHRKTPWTFIILGRSGPTGKTWLQNGLNIYGLDAIEITDSVWKLVDYRDNQNHVIKNDENRTIIVVLNQPLKKGENV